MGVAMPEHGLHHMKRVLDLGPHTAGLGEVEQDESPLCKSGAMIVTGNIVADVSGDASSKPSRCSLC